MLADDNTVYKLIGPVLVKQARDMLLCICLRDHLPAFVAYASCLSSQHACQ